MVKRAAKSSLSEEDGEVLSSGQTNKRVKEDESQDGKKKPKTFGLYRQPTVQELNRLQETEHLFNSNLFRLQVDEILQEVKVKEKAEKKFTEWFAQFKTHLLAIPEDDNEYDLTEQTLFKKLKVKLPVGNDLNKTKCMFNFHKFTDVQIVGSYSLGCPINSKLVVDVQITVPAETYTKNDSINYRYHKKRAAYLACIASHINKTELIDEIKYSLPNGCKSKPILYIKPAGKVGNHLSVRLNLTCEAEAYKFHRFSPSRNNLRDVWLFSTEKEKETNDIGPPTPYYNSSVLSDLTAAENQVFLNELLSKSENLKQAIVLLKIWLRQRKLSVSGHIVSLLVAYYVQIKRINNIMSSYQIVRNVWIALKSSEFDTKGITLHKGTDTPSIEDFHQHFPIVFIDHTGYYNILWQMCRGTYQALKRESELAVEMLDNGKINSFIPLFMTPVKPLMLFDHIISFKKLAAAKEAFLSKIPKDAQLNYGTDQLALITHTLHTLLSKGLGNRAHLVLEIVDADFTWPVKTSLDKAKDGFEEKLSFGLILNPETAFNIVEKGPPANLPDAEQFRAFWGDKSELRRFQDGSITEACVWAGHTAAHRRTVSRQIVDYLMMTKYGLPPTSIHHSLDQLSCLTVSRRTGDYVEESSARTLHAFDDLRRDLRQLKNIPLDVTAVYGVSSVLSYSNPLPPSHISNATRLSVNSVPEYTPVCEAVLELGHSGKWPGDIEAFRCLKAAFHLQISEQLHKQYGMPTKPYPTHVDVLKNNLVFRLKIAHPKEITLVKKEIENGVAKFRESDESVKLTCDTVIMPRLRGALHGLHTKYPSYGPTTCLFKRWLSSHLLAHHFPAPTAELLTALVYVHSAPLHPPTMPTVGLIRVLEKLAYTDWAAEVFVLDFNDDMTREEITSLEQKLTSNPSRPALCIATPYDTPPAALTGGVPAPGLARARVLAHTTITYIHSCHRSMEDDLMGAFIPSLSGYDATIVLHKHLVPYYRERIDQPPRKAPVQEELSSIPVVEFHPVLKYLDELRSAYSEFALFFHDVYGGDVIAVLWKPDIGEYKDFQLLAANALVPVTVKGETKYKVNTAALLEDFRILGEGLVDSVTVHT